MGIDNMKFENAKSKLDSDFDSAWSTIKELSDSGNEEAMIFVADCYYKGKYIEMDEALAYQMFNKIISMYPDNGLIWEKIADCHFYGYGVPKSHQVAISKYEEAWKHGYIDAASDIGWIYAFGDISQNNEQTAAKWFQRAADKGGAAGKYFMGFFYDKGYGGLPQSQKLAHKYLSESAAEDNLSALRYLLRERCFGDDDEFVRVLNRMNTLAQEGNSNVQYDLGISYLYGFGVEKNERNAQDLLEKAADAGNYDAMLELGKRLVDYDNEFPIDFEKGHNLLLKVAENGNLDAAYELYRYYKYHDDNLEQAVLWAERCVENGSSTFLRKDVADFYYNDGNVKDFQKTIRYYEEILNDESDFSHSQVMLPLAVCYIKLGHEVEKYSRIMSLLDQARQFAENNDDYFNKPRKGEILYWKAYMTEKGPEGTKNLEVAYRLYIQSAEEGYEKAGLEAQKFKKTLFGWKKI